MSRGDVGVGAVSVTEGQFGPFHLRYRIVAAIVAGVGGGCGVSGAGAYRSMGHRRASCVTSSSGSGHECCGGVL